MTDPAPARPDLTPPPPGPAAAPVPAGPDGEPAYADALTELEDILDSLEADQVDVDTLASRVERAATLIRLCRARLGSARAKVDAVVDELEHEDEDEDDDVVG